MVELRATVLFKEMGLIKLHSVAEIPAPSLVSRALDIGPKTVEVVTGMKVVDPMILRSFRVPPGTIDELAGAAVFHRRAGHINVLSIARMFCCSGEHRGAKHIRVVDRALRVGQVANAIAASSFFSRKIHDPAADAVVDLKPAGTASLLVSVKISKTDQARPNDDRIVLAVRTAAAGEIKMVATTIVQELWRFVAVEPVKA